MKLKDSNMKLSFQRITTDKLGNFNVGEAARNKDESLLHQKHRKPKSNSTWKLPYLETSGTHESL